jgi:ubiquinone/menaquinone biosynthesis C-methylase UbiE
LLKARTELECVVQGIAPEPGAQRVGTHRMIAKIFQLLKALQKVLPFENDSFDVVYSSRVLEHVKSQEQVLDEMKRVLKPGDVLIIGIPTATMSWVTLFSAYLFTTQILIYHFIRSLGNKNLKSSFIRIFIPTSHSFPRENCIL